MAKEKKSIIPKVKCEHNFKRHGQDFELTRAPGWLGH